MGILVIDDSEEERNVFEAVLAIAGFNDVITADSAASAFSLLALDAPQLPDVSPIDLVLLDVMMPGMDGFEACARIRGDRRYTDIPVVMTTALDDVESIANAFKSGATDFLCKPLKNVDLIECVRTSLKLKEELERCNTADGGLFQWAPLRFECRDLKTWRDSVNGRWRNRRVTVQ